MIRLTYKVSCDLCNKKCDKTEYVVNVNFDFPEPTREFSYKLRNATVELCDKCAAPLVDTLNAVMHARGEK